MIQDLLTAVQMTVRESREDVGCVRQELDAVAKGLKTLVDDQRPLAELPRHMTDLAQQVHDAVRTMADAHDKILARLSVAMEGRQRRPAGRYERLGWGVAGLILGGALWLGWAWWWPEHHQAQLAIALDTILVPAYSTLPPPVQQSLTKLYDARGYASPAQRQKGK
jgi:hypothetical protein